MKDERQSAVKCFFFLVMHPTKVLQPSITHIKVENYRRYFVDKFVATENAALKTYLDGRPSREFRAILNPLAPKEKLK